MRSIGFTGTQEGMTIHQKVILTRFLIHFNNRQWMFRHGDCLGADAQAHRLAEINKYRIVIHPPLNESKRAFCKTDTALKPKEYLDRNHDIVDESWLIFATPKEAKEVMRSGTWATIRYAKKRKKHLIIIYPSGKIERF